MIKTYYTLLFLLLACSYGYAQEEQQDQRLANKQKLASIADDTASVDLLYNLAFSYVFELPDTAIKYVQQGLNISKSIKYKKGEANCLNLLSMALSISGNYSGALHFGFECLSLSEEIGDSSLILSAYDNLTICYREQEDYKEALKYGYKGLSYSESPKIDIYLKPLFMGTMSSVFEKMNQLDSALYYGLKAFESSKSWWSGIYLTLGNIYGKSGEMHQSFIYYRTGLKMAEQNSISIDIVDIYHKMSIAFESAGNLDSSFHYAKESMEAAGAGFYPEGELRAAEHLAQLYEIREVKDSTIKYLKRSSSLKNSLSSRQKTREAQSFAFNEQWHQQELLAQIQQNKSKVRMYILAGLIVLILFVAYFLWRNNRHKQKSNILLQEKNTEIQAALTTLKDTQNQLIQSEKMASLGELTAGIAHEIQNPLNFVNNFSELNQELIIELNEEILKGNSQLAKTIAESIRVNEQKINHHGKRADAIVKGMLQLSQGGNKQKEPTNINKLVEEYQRLAFYAFQARDKDFTADIKTAFDNGIGDVLVYPKEMGKCLFNIFSNAFYAVNEKRKTGEEQYTPAIFVQTQKTDGKVVIRVGDNGPGIQEKIVDKIFQPFFTTRPTGQGTGLGLSLSYDIVKAHGGEIRVENTKEWVTVFIVSFPV